MKTYEKPKLIALSLGGNDRLCGDCADNNATKLLHDDPILAEQIFNITSLTDLNEDGITKDDFKNVFGMGECDIQYYMYCKFTSSGGTIAWS